MLANAATPLLGLVDTAVIGRSGDVAGLGALALGALIFNFLYWAFGFLRMGTTGFVAAAHGAGDAAELRAAAARALLLGAGFGLLLWLLRAPLALLALELFGASAEVEDGARRYLTLRLWGAPASLATFALMGVLIGLARTGEVLRVQLLLNALNIVFDLLFALVLGFGLAGIAVGTALAEWLALGYALWRLHRVLAVEAPGPSPDWARLRDLVALRRMLKANGDILLRTLTMLASFAWFVNSAAGYGDATLAANHLLLQFVSLSAYVLDGYAHAAEPLVGRALGARDRGLYRRTLARGLHLAVAAGLAMAALVAWAGPTVIDLLTTLTPVREVAHSYLLWPALYVALSTLAFQLDGVFIGAGATVAMRNMALLSAALFGLAQAMLQPLAGYAGLWAAFVLYVLARGLSLSACLPALGRRLDGAAGAKAAPAPRD